MIGDLRERVTRVETTLEHALPAVTDLRHRQQALGGRVYAVEMTTAPMPSLVERVAQIERRLDTTEQRHAERSASKTHRKEQRQDALKAMSLLLAAGTMVLWAVGKIPDDVARPMLSALGLGK